MPHSFDNVRMTSRQIAELCGKLHKNVLQDARKIAAELGVKIRLESQGLNLSPEKSIESNSLQVSESHAPNLGAEINDFIITESTYISRGKDKTMFSFNETAALLIVSNYSKKLHLLIIQEWRNYRNAFEDSKWVIDDKNIQRRVMGVIQKTIETPIKIDYIKANVIVNKATSNYHGLDKMITKKVMNEDMLKDRQSILIDFERLFEVMADYSAVKVIIYAKYTNKLLK